MDIMRTYISNELLVDTVRDLASRYGFAVRYDIKVDLLPYIEDEDVNFCFMRNFNFDEYKKTGKALLSYTLNVSVKRMGGQPTVQELRQTAKRISKAAEMMEEFNRMKYVVEEE